MHLVLIGGNSASKVNEIVSSNYDNIKVSIYPSVRKFVEVSNVRSLEVDRFIFLQDAEEVVSGNYTLIDDFNDYISRQYPATSFIAVLRDMELAERMVRIYISPLFVIVCKPKMKPTDIQDLVRNKPTVLLSKYGLKNTFESDSEIVDEYDPNIVKEEKSKKSPKVNPSQGKKKVGLFGGLFGGKKNKSSLKSKVKDDEKGQDISDSGSLSTEYEDENKENTATSEHQESGYNEVTEPEDVNFDAYQDEDEGEVNYTVFDEGSLGGLGLGSQSSSNKQGVSEAKNVDDSEDSDDPSSDLDWTSSSHDFSSFDSFSSESDWGSFDDLGSKSDLEDEDDPSGGDNGESSIFGEDETYPDFVEEGIDINLDEKVSKLHELKDSVFKRELDVSLTDEVTPVSRVSNPLDFCANDDEELVFDGLESQLDEYNNHNTRVVEKVVEVQKIVQVGVKKKTYKNGIRTIVVTGDRKTGVTRIALNMASHFAKQESTLYVDFDKERRGSLLYLGLENVALLDDSIQSGLVNLRNPRMLPNIVHTFPKGGFDCLFAVYGVDIEDGQLITAQRALSAQRDYKTLIIDCPLENLHCLRDILLYSETVICVDSDVPNILNTVMGLSKVSEELDIVNYLFNNGQYLLSMGDDTKEFKQSMAYITDLFSLDEGIDWGSMPILGTVSEFETALESL